MCHGWLSHAFFLLVNLIFYPQPFTLHHFNINPFLSRRYKFYFPPIFTLYLHDSLLDVEGLLDYLGGVCHQVVLGVSEGVQGQLPLLLPLVQILVQRLQELGAPHLRHQVQGNRDTRLIASLEIS